MSANPPTRIVNPTVSRSRVDPEREYVVISPRFTPETRQLLSAGFDPFNDWQVWSDLPRMMHDPEVASCVKTVMIGILADGCQLLPAVANDDERYEKAVEIGEFCTWNLANLYTPFRNSLAALWRNGFVYGFKVAEKVYDYPEAIYPNNLCLRALKVKPLESCGFVVDEFYNILGLAAAHDARKQTSSNSIVYSNNVDKADIIPREKFVIYSHAVEDEDPRGTSGIRTAYTSWKLKTTLWPTYARYIDQYGAPFVIATVAKDAEDQQEIKDGVPQLEEDGTTPKMVTAETALFYQAKQLKNFQVIVVTEGNTIQLEQPAAGGGDAISKALGEYDSQITKAILLQTLATRESDHYSRAASFAHMTVLDLLIWYYKGEIADLVRWQILYYLVWYNFGPEYIDLVPKVSFGDTERRNFESEATAIARLMASKYFDDSQLDGTDQLLGVPERDPDWRDRKKQEMLEMERAKQPAQDPDDLTDGGTAARDNILQDDFIEVDNLAQATNLVIKNKVFSRINPVRDYVTFRRK